MVHQINSSAVSPIHINLVICMNDADFNLHYISDAKHLFPETVAPKKYGQVNFDRNVYQDALLVCTFLSLLIYCYE